MAMNHYAKQIKAINPEYDLDKISITITERFPMLNRLDADNNQHAIMACQIMLKIMERAILLFFVMRSILKKCSLQIQFSNTKNDME
ncbi:hypothetical protein [Legionella sp. W05-934-2]|jgi:hypothetical protein|uniref:hypothetical protein n=1 Tax=Legionella sp. W05-934-2 TaxID=1198649 RepID=UPI003462B13D